MFVKRGSILLLVLMMVGTSLGTAPRPAAGQSPPLDLYILTVDELGPAYRLMFVGPLPEITEMGYNHTSLAATRQTARSGLLPEVSGIILLDAATIDVAQAVGLAVQMARVQDVAITPLGEFDLGGVSATRYSVGGQVFGFRVSGDVLVWQQGPVIAAVAAISTGGGDASAVARAQVEKLRLLQGE